MTNQAKKQQPNQKTGIVKNMQPKTQKELGKGHGLSLIELRNKMDERANRFDFEPCDISPAYQKRLKGEDLSPVDRIFKRAFTNVKRPQKKIKPILSITDAKKLAWYICQEKAAALNFEFVVDETNRALLSNLTKYFANDDTGEYDLRKGLFLSGDVGLGKTFLMSIFQDFAKSTEKKMFKVFPCIEVFDNVSIAKSKDNDPLRNIFKYYKGNICFDDLGQEPTSLKSYGNEVFVMEKILTERYKKFINGHCITHITSNLTASELKERYGIRVFDRCKEMFEFIHFSGVSKRK
jgi:DNA replication protein DnaC